MLHVKNNLFHSLRWLSVFWVCLAYLTGCAVDERYAETSSLEEFNNAANGGTQQNEEIKKINEKIFLSAQTEPDPEGYFLGPGDLITVSVFESADLNAEGRISSRGQITIPMLGKVEVNNLSAGEAEEKIENLLTEKYLHQAHVTIFIKEHVSKQVSVVGALKNPGRYDYVSQRRILDLLAMADGLSESASDVAYISRKNKEGQESVEIIDLEELLERGNVALNVTIKPGDVIFVPEAGVCHVDGAVRQPGPVKIDGDMTIDAAISAAGGFEGYADEDNVKLIRYLGNGKRKVVKLTQSDLVEGEAKNLLLQDKDVLYVEASGSKTFFSGFGVSLGFMGTGVTYKSPVK